MLEIMNITPDFAIAPQISADDITLIADRGFRSILNARPDDEDGAYMLSAEAASMAEKHNLSYAHVATANHAIFEPDIIDAFEVEIARLPTPVLAHCKSGTRAAILWAMVAARHRPLERIFTTLKQAGQDLEFLEQELQGQADEARGSPLRLKDDGLMRLGRSRLLG